MTELEFREGLEKLVKDYTASTDAHCEKMKQDAEDYCEHTNKVKEYLLNEILSLYKKTLC